MIEITLVAAEHPATVFHTFHTDFVPEINSTISVDDDVVFKVLWVHSHYSLWADGLNEAKASVTCGVAELIGWLRDLRTEDRDT